MKKILVITGHTGAGKSTVCQYLANFYNVPLISFAGIGKDFSYSLGYKRIRECYKEIGLVQFKELFSKYFFARISESLKEFDCLIVDGLYLDDTAAKLNISYKTLYVYIDVPESICKRRIAERLGLPNEMVDGEYILKENLKQNLGSIYVINHTDVVIDGTKNKDDVCKDVVNLNFFSTY